MESLEVVVTGCNGYIGSVLSSVLLNKGYSVKGVDIDYYKDCTLYRWYPEIPYLQKDIMDITTEDLKGVDVVMHLAAISNDPMGKLDPRLTQKVNVESAKKFAGTAKKAGVSKFIFSSSCSVYGRQEEGNIVNEKSPEDPLTEYAKSKVEFEKSLLELADDNFIPISLRNATVYGSSPLLRFDLVVNNMTGCAYTTKKIVVNSDGTPWRPLTHVKDVSKAFIAAMNAEKIRVNKQIFNVGSNTENYRVRDIISIIQKRITDCEVEFLNSEPDSRSYKVDFSKISQTLGFTNDWNVEKGVDELVNVFDEVKLDYATFQSDKFYRVKVLKKIIDSRVGK